MVFRQLRRHAPGPRRQLRFRLRHAPAVPQPSYDLQSPWMLRPEKVGTILQPRRHRHGSPEISWHIPQPCENPALATPITSIGYPRTMTFVPMMSGRPSKMFGHAS